MKRHECSDCAKGSCERDAQEREFDRRIWLAHHNAWKQAETEISVAIHVGQGVWDYLIGLASVDPQDPIAKVGVFGGYPLVLEKAWEPETIQVRTVRVIP